MALRVVEYTALCHLAVRTCSLRWGLCHVQLYTSGIPPPSPFRSLDQVLRELGGIAVIRLWRLHNGVGDVLRNDQGNGQGQVAGGQVPADGRSAVHKRE